MITRDPSIEAAIISKAATLSLARRQAFGLARRE